MKKNIVILFIFSFFITISFVLISKNFKLWEIRFKKVLDDIKQNSINNYDWNLDNWNKYFEKQLGQLPIYNKSKFFTAINNALKDLNDNHSFLISNIKNNHQEEFQEKDYSIIMQDGIGIINIPPINCDVSAEDKSQSFLNEKWVSSFHKDLEKIKNKVTKGWIIDLTKNIGGNMYPMIASLSYFYTNMSIGGFYSFGFNEKPEKTIITFDGQSFFFNNKIGLRYRTKFPINKNKLPVVVLIGNETASSAEFLTLVLKRQNNIILMGQDTYGIATGNEVMSLPDNLGHYMLTVCYYLDINDQPLLEKKIRPKIMVKDKEKMIDIAKNYLENKIN